MNVFCGLCAGLFLASIPAAIASEAPVNSERLIHPERENWLLPHRTYNGWQYSPLAEINKKNVGKLKLAFALPLGMRVDGGGDNQAVPLVDSGFMYLIDPTGTVFKIDVHGARARTVWTFDTATPLAQQGASRGVALMGEAVIVNTRDGRVIALRRDTGDPIWEKKIGVPHEGFTAPPTIVKDLVIVGQSFGDMGTRGYVAALDGKTGVERWRFYTVPGPGERGHETWPADNDSWLTGGGSIWVASTYDPETNSLFVGTGNPAPALDPEARPGDNLYTSSIVVLDADSGKLKWYHQYTPNDPMEHDENSPHLLFDVPIQGRMRQVLGHFSRTGYYFTLDRNSGAFIGAAPVQEKIDWTGGINAQTGQPVEYDASKAIQNYKTDVRRGTGSAKFCGGGYVAGFWPPAYDPLRGRVYHMFIDTCFIVVVKPEAGSGTERFGKMGLAGSMYATIEDSRLAALDAKNGRTVVKKDIGIISQSGVLATAGGLVFVGLGDGTIQARDSDTLQTRWSINVGTPFKAPPIAYAVDGKQYIAIIGGGGPQTFGGVSVPALAEARNSSILFVFALPGDL
jgi:alcohol dehydrogenase (cytochrome c)